MSPVGSEPHSQRNLVKLWTEIDGELISHFSLHEFENADGLVCIDPSVLRSLEALRRNLSADEHEEIQLIITNATRTDADNERLAGKYGWTDKGGSVSKDSRHLVRNGCKAVDFYARRKSTRFQVYSGKRRRLPVEQVAFAAWQVFDFVKKYADRHVHGDNREGGGKVNVES